MLTTRRSQRRKLLDIVTEVANGLYAVGATYAGIAIVEFFIHDWHRTLTTSRLFGVVGMALLLCLTLTTLAKAVLVVVAYAYSMLHDAFGSGRPGTVGELLHMLYDVEPFEGITLERFYLAYYLQPLGLGLATFNVTLPLFGLQEFVLGIRF